MQGRRVSHSQSTNFHDFPNLHSAKRRKTEESTDADELSSRDESDIRPAPATLRIFGDEIPDSEDEGESDEETRAVDYRPTELESALPPVKTDKDAIAEYETIRAAEDETSNDFKNRLASKKWTRGRSSIYVDAFNLALETVLQDEAHLFDEAESEIFKQWRSLEYEVQYLYVRLFLRKTSVWHRISRLTYYDDISDLAAAVEILQSRRVLPQPAAERQVNPGELSPPQYLAFGRSFTFADGSDTEIATLEEASSLLNLEELKVIAKESKLQGRNKPELLKALRQTTQRQIGIEASLRISNSKQSLASEDSPPLKKDPESPPQHGKLMGGSDSLGTSHDKTREQYFIDKIMTSVGVCVRLSLPALKLFERVHLVFYRSTEWTDKSLTTIILARISRRNFPQYIVSRSANIFESRSALLEFEAAVRTQFHVDYILEFNGTPKKEGMQEILSIFEEVYPRWTILLQEEQKKEDRIYESGEGAYLRRFSPAHVYTRIIHKAAYVLGKQKDHLREHEVLAQLLSQRLFHAARRGAWYQRKALLEEHYMPALRPIPGMDNLDQQKRHWRRVSLKTCEEGLQDRECHVIYHYDLQKRIRKLERGLKLAKREQHNFEHVSLAKPTERVVEGIQVIKKVPSGRSPGPFDRGKSTKTIWIDEREGGGECCVEAMCLSFYRDQGYRGYHCEGGIIRTLFGYLFYDVLFVYVPNVFQTPYQTCPLDLHTDSFFPTRASEINSRLVDIANGRAEELIQKVDSRERENNTCVVGLNWDFTLQDMLEVASCFEGPALATICKVMAQEYRARGGGMPDLFLWNLERKEVMFSEVKSENDRLSDTQRQWIHVLTAAGIKVELCNAVAKGVQIREE